MNARQTPEDRFANLSDFPWSPAYTEVDGLRMAHVEDGPASGPAVLMLHGEPTWSYLYRKMIGPVAAAGCRVLAPDLIGFGRSDKPTKVSDYSYSGHVAWVRGWIEALDLGGLTLVCQDWGSLIGLRLLAEIPERFDAAVVANGFLPIADRPMPRAFRIWRAFARYTPVFPCGRIVASGCARPLSAEARAAYDAPYPGESWKAGARAFPRLVPAEPDNPAVPDNRRAWEALGRWEKPMLTAFGDRDPIFRGADRALQAHVPGCKGQAHTTLRRAGHFIQEDAGEELAAVVAGFVTAR